MRITPVRTITGKLGFKIEPENVTDSNLLTEFEVSNVVFEVEVDNNSTTVLTIIDNN